MVVLTPEGYDNLHTGDSHRSPICHTGDSHRSRFVTPEPSHRRRVDHTGSICSAHTGISTQQNFARPNSGVTLASPAAEIQRKVASKRLSASSMQERGRDRDEKEERREKREEREENLPTSTCEGAHLKTVVKPTSNYLRAVETAGLLLISSCLNRLALEACASLATRNACSSVLGRLGANPARRQASLTPAPRLRSWLAS